MEEILQLVLSGVEVCEPVSAGRMRVFGVRGAGASELSYGTLDDALAAGTVTLTEIDESGTVPQLNVTNKSDEMLFLMAGEQLTNSMLFSSNQPNTLAIECQVSWGLKYWSLIQMSALRTSRIRRRTT